ncbi:unnamed protein product [Allacma fusca]|uniref:Uncharacterized protein n=1 Tax=Allacma fusca TaxID=39272 RepID=A0A8J2P6C4_9HEXA|nr:unnamed protein product [Allacma fusca]
MYFKFKVLTLEVGERLLSPGNICDTTLWRQSTFDFYKLCEFLKKINGFLSPLIFLSFATNTYFICNQLHQAYIETASQNVFRRIYTTWSFLHLILRKALVHEAGSRIHFWAHEIAEVFSKCPDSAYVSQVERAERYVNSNTIALSGLGCFFVTKPLILHSFGVVFTGVIVLLQATKFPQDDKT